MGDFPFFYGFLKASPKIAKLQKNYRIAQGEQSGYKERGYQQCLDGETEMCRKTVSHGGRDFALNQRQEVINSFI